jgi:hypothetical protein
MTAKLAEKPKPAAASQPVKKSNATDIDLKDRDAAFQLGIKQGHESGWLNGWTDGHKAGFSSGIAAAHAIYTATSKTAAESVRAAVYAPVAPPKRVPPRPVLASDATTSDKSPLSSTTRPVQTRQDYSKSVPGGADGLPLPQRKVLASIGFWQSVGTSDPNRSQVAGVAGYSPSSGGFNNLLGQLNTAGLITIPRPGCVSLAAGAPHDELTPDQAKDKVLSVLSRPQRKLVDAVLDSGAAMTREALGEATEYSPNSGGFNNLIGELCSLTVFEKPAPGQVNLSAWAREVLA